MKCHCGSEIEYASCCKPFVEDDEFAPTALQLMRSRYTAYSTNDINYIIKTMRKDAAKSFDAHSASQWAANVLWQGLEIVSSYERSENVATVEFIARYISQGKMCFIHENSEFHRMQGIWYYVAGHLITPGRNDMCDCGSGKKFKKCCA